MPEWLKKQFRDAGYDVRDYKKPLHVTAEKKTCCILQIKFRVL
jgi:hypothetical protein